MPRGTKDRRRPAGPFRAARQSCYWQKTDIGGGVHRGASTVGGTLGVTLPYQQPHIRSLSSEARPLTSFSSSKPNILVHKPPQTTRDNTGITAGDNVIHMTPVPGQTGA
ncbi:hypothetical protein TNCT_567361 [Trichonephila clavata]|uniref:Uncharacterized protein n=1 Tax=Trichonephila clavata TaxID=2740835 RepID=A0A8X6LA71_TRICU|nr:hypothetical protein TNCT_567361 [Trichonephila clavata]